MNRKHDTKPLPLRPPKPASTPASAVQRQVASSHIRLGLDAGPILKPPQPLATEQSYFSDDTTGDDDHDHDHANKKEKENTGKVKSWFPPKPSSSRADNSQPPSGSAETRRVPSTKPKIVESASRKTRHLPQFSLLLSVRHIETTEVPIVSTPRDLIVSTQPPPSRALASPFPDQQGDASDQRRTAIRPRGDYQRASYDHPTTTRGPLTGRDTEQQNAI